MQRTPQTTQLLLQPNARRFLVLAIVCLACLLGCQSAWADKRRDIGFGLLFGGGFQDGPKSGSFTVDGPIVANDDMRGLAVLPGLSLRKFFLLSTKRHFLDLSLDAQWFLGNMIWKIVQGAQNNILHIPINLGAQLCVWFFRGPVKFYVGPGMIGNINIFVGGGDGGIAAEFQFGLRLGVEYVIPSKVFGVEFFLWPYGALGVFGGQNSRHNTVPAGSAGGAGMLFAIAVHFYGTKNL